MTRARLERLSGGYVNHMPLGEGFDFTEREVVLRADLSEVDYRGLVCTPVRFIMNGPRTPRPGEQVLLVDVGGDATCIGEVVSITGWEVCVRPDWKTRSGVPAQGTNTP